VKSVAGGGDGGEAAEAIARWGSKSGSRQREEDQLGRFVFMLLSRLFQPKRNRHRQ
jgi:hypothetical protein